MKDFINKWYYIDNPNGGYIYLKYNEFEYKNKKILSQVLLSGNKMMDGVYLIDKYDLKEENGKYSLRLINFDIHILGDDKELLKEDLIKNNYLTNEEFEKYYGINKILDDVEKIEFIK